MLSLPDYSATHLACPAPMAPIARPKVRNRRPGRHPIPINWSFVSQAFQANATVEEVAAAVGITTQHLRRRIRAEIGVEPAAEIERMRQVGRLKLRMRQHASAIGSEASVQMLVWLGKQRLGQTDKRAVQSRVLDD